MGAGHFLMYPAGLDESTTTSVPQWGLDTLNTSLFSLQPGQETSSDHYGLCKFRKPDARKRNKAGQSTIIENPVNVLARVFGRVRISKTKPEIRIRIPSTYAHGIGPEEYLTRESRATAALHAQGQYAKRVGFKAESLIKAGALQGPAGLHMKSTLSGGIHPILAESNWSNTPPHIFQQIRPALLLATKFLTAPQAMQHFLTVWQGQRDVCSFTSARMGKPCHRISSEVAMNAERAEATVRRLWSLANKMTFSFDAVWKDWPRTELYAGTGAIKQLHHCFSPSLGNGSPQKMFICLHTDFMRAAHHFSRLQYPEPAQVLRFNFLLACVIVHEICHAFEMETSPYETSLMNEVYMHGSREAESGRAWEKSIFGGAIHPINDRVDGTYGVCVLEWPGVEGVMPEGRSVPMQYIWGLFQEEAWVEASKRPVDGDGQVFCLPPGGAESVELCATFTTLL